MSAEAHAVATTSAMLEIGAIMLGTALVFVILFRKLKLGATLGYIVGGALIGPHLLGLIQDPEQMASIAEIGRTSMKIDVEAWRRTRHDDRSYRVTRATFTFVAIGEDRQPRTVPPMLAA